MSDNRLVKKSVSKLHCDNVFALGKVACNLVAQVKRALVKRRKGRGEHVITHTAAVYIKDVKAKAEYKALRILGLFIKRKALAKLDCRRFYTDSKATLAKSYPFCFICKGAHSFALPINFLFFILSYQAGGVNSFLKFIKVIDIPCSLN